MTRPQAGRGGAMAENEQRCRCGQPHDNWPDGKGGMLCQMCWELDCDAEWWRVVIAFDQPRAALEGDNGRE